MSFSFSFLIPFSILSKVLVLCVLPHNQSPEHLIKKKKNLQSKEPNPKPRSQTNAKSISPAQHSTLATQIDSPP